MIDHTAIAHLTDDLVFDNNAVPDAPGRFTPGRNLELETGHDMMQEVSHLRG